MEAPWTKPAEEILAFYNVDPDGGLDAAQVSKHAQLYGKNGGSNSSSNSIFHVITVFHLACPVLPEDPPTPLWELILEQFKDQLVLILLGSAVVSFVLALFEDSSDSSWGGAFVEPLVILLILVANATVGVVQESSAEQAIDVSQFFQPFRRVPNPL